MHSSPHALAGEQFASGGLHADNVAPSLVGGMVLCPQVLLPRIVRLPVPRGLTSVLVHPELQVNTAESRKGLARGYSLDQWLTQQGYLAGFVAACASGDVELFSRCLRDDVIEPQRAASVPCFAAGQGGRAQDCGALGCSLSGSGPSIFAICADGAAGDLATAMEQACRNSGYECESWISALDAPGCSPGTGRMKLASTRRGETVSLDEALVKGIAADGGLYLPESFPSFTPSEFDGDATIHDVAERLLAPFFAESTLRNELPNIVAETFSFPVPVTSLDAGGRYCGLLELFHGPTAAFKDVGAGFLAACLSRLEGDIRRPLTILVATSGDTGGAVAAAFDKRPGMRVAVLYPNGRVSERQAHQLTCWSDNVLSLAVDGSFDDCQALVKGAMADKDLANRHRFSSANSINIGRLLPQSIYYANASLAHTRETGRAPSFIVPTGNLGNALACFLARHMGLPIADIILATNANRLIVDFLGGENWTPRASIHTLASAMDVGNPSNMERLRFIGGDGATLARQVRGTSVDDDEIREEIRQTWEVFGLAVCPHTATGLRAWRRLDEIEQMEKDWIIAATAHPAKFEQIVEPVIGHPVPLPPELADILARPRRFVEIEPNLGRAGRCPGRAVHILNFPG